MRILVTGGCGFIGHHLVEHLIKTTFDALPFFNTKADIIVWDKLTYASSGFDRLRDINVFNDKRVSIIGVDFSKKITEGVVSETGDVDYIVHVGAETHVDKSIEDAEPFVTANVVGTLHMLEYARTCKNLRGFFYFSTDEVFGPAPESVKYKEWDRYNSTNPYSATKAGGEELCLAFANTYNVPVVITHTMNVFGERQHPEKFIPTTIRKVLLGEINIVHANKKRTVSGSRFYIHARNVASAITFLFTRAKLREKYNIVGEQEVSNLEMVLLIGNMLGKEPKFELTDFHSSRPGHDLRYALDGSKMFKEGWRIPVEFSRSLAKTVQWYLLPENKRWLGV